MQMQVSLLAFGQGIIEIFPWTHHGTPLKFLNGCPQDLFWKLFEPAFNFLWSISGSPLNLLWTSLGRLALEVFWNCYGSQLQWFWIYSEVLWTEPETSLELTWEISRLTVKVLWIFPENPVDFPINLPWNCLGLTMKHLCDFPLSTRKICAEHAFNVLWTFSGSPIDQPWKSFGKCTL